MTAARIITVKEVFIKHFKEKKIIIAYLILKFCMIQILVLICY